MYHLQRCAWKEGMALSILQEEQTVMKIKKS